MNVTKPLKLGMHVMNAKDGKTWINFQYDFFSDFHYNCRIIRHNEEFYVKENQKNPDPNAKNPFGPCLNLQNMDEKSWNRRKKDTIVTL